MKMGGPEMAPHTPHARRRPGIAVAPLGMVLRDPR